MSNSEIANTFDESRDEFKPYGLTCELWTPNLMRRPDRHNEIEINYFMEGSMTYLFQEKRITVPAKRLTVFWGLIPHQIVHYDTNAPYFVCTIPFSLFLEWKLPTSFVNRVLKGEAVIEAAEEAARYDEFLLNNWIEDTKKQGATEVTILEMHARLIRLASSLSKQVHNPYSIHSADISQVERMAIYIAQNYRKPIKVADVGTAVGLHPDYANAIFKKAFDSTLSQYITKERIAHAQRNLVVTDTSITEIAFDCGFNSISRFNAAFLKINRCTPREYRKKY